MRSDAESRAPGWGRWSCTSVGLLCSGLVLAAGCFVDRRGTRAGPACEMDFDCAPGLMCVAGMCRLPVPDAGHDSGIDAAVDAGIDAGFDAGIDSGPTFDPRTLGGLALWLRADGLAPGPIDTWMDESGNERHATTVDGPLSVGSTGTHPHVDFDGSASFIAPAFSWGGGTSIFLVTRMDSAAVTSGRFLYTSNGHLFMSRNDTELLLKVGSSTRRVPARLDTWTLWSVLDDGATTGLYNGVSPTPEAQFGRAIPTNSLVMGIGGNPPGSRRGLDLMTGAIAEVLLFDRALTTGEADGVRGYLADKWGGLLPP